MRADPRFAGDGYVLLDSHRVGPEDLRRDNAAALLAGLENPLPSTLPELVGALCRRLRAPELRELRETMLSWAGWRARQAGLTIEAEDMAQVNRMENPDDVENLLHDAGPDMGGGTSAPKVGSRAGSRDSASRCEGTRQ